MKKFILLIITSIAVFSCSNNETMDTIPFEKAITFKAINDRVSSRAANATNDNYQVLAKETGGDAWYINEAVNGNTKDIISGNTYNWLVPAVEIDFWAYAPASNSAI